MTDESTLLLPGLVDRGGGVLGEGGPGDTALDVSQRPAVTHMELETRGRTRERDPLRSNRASNAADMRVLHDAVSAVSALHAALGNNKPAAPSGEPHEDPFQDEGSLDSVRNLRDEQSPEKRPRVSTTTKMPGTATAPKTTHAASAPVRAPHFGGGHHPPLFHGRAARDTEAAARTAEAALGNAAAPQHFDLTEPPWVSGLRGDIQGIARDQGSMSAQLAESARALQALQASIQHLGEGHEALLRRADAQETAIQKMQGELRELERELTAIKSAPGTRSASPALSSRGGAGGPSTPRAAGVGPIDVDELQVVIGGWSECKREHIQQDVHEMFQNLDAVALIKHVFTPYVRSGYCRVEITYPEPDIWKQRKLQGIIVQGIKDMSFSSRSPGQANCKFWAARNRSVQERAKIRAILSTQDLCLRHLGPGLVDKDWKGRVWANSVQILHHVDMRERPLNTLMLIDSRGNETGWFLDLDQVQAVLGVSRDVILAHFDAH